VVDVPPSAAGVAGRRSAPNEPPGAEPFSWWLRTNVTRSSCGPANAAMPSRCYRIDWQTLTLTGPDGTVLTFRASDLIALTDRNHDTEVSF
jgi:hypothetical protein